MKDQKILVNHSEDRTMLDNIHHLAIQVKNIDESISWYREKFNLNIKYQDDSWALLEFDNISIALVLKDQHPNHFGILKDNAESFGSLKKHRDDTRSIYISDPSGNSVEILDKKSVIDNPKL